VGRIGWVANHSQDARARSPARTQLTVRPGMTLDSLIDSTLGKVLCGVVLAIMAAAVAYAVVLSLLYYRAISV